MILLRPLLVVCAAVIVAAACGAQHHSRARGVASVHTTTGATCHAHGSGLFELPDKSRACTPGDWIDSLAHAKAHVCEKGYNPRPPESVTSLLKRQVMKLYGVPSSEASRVESDHYFPLWLGGATTRANLWPEPNYATAQGGGFVHNPKDDLEIGVKGLYRRVCVAHSVTVGQARRAFEGNWVTAYRKYVGPTS